MNCSSFHQISTINGIFICRRKSLFSYSASIVFATVCLQCIACVFTLYETLSIFKRIFYILNILYILYKKRIFYILFCCSIQIGQYMKANGEVVSNLNITSIQTNDGGLYACVASSAVGSVRHSSKINVYGLPYIR